MGANVRQFGARGDDRSDDTAAIQKAIDAAAKVQGAVWFPPGLYRSSMLQVRDHVALVGVPTWSYSRHGGTVIRLGDEKAKCLINLCGAIGPRVSGLALEGGRLGNNVHGIYLDGEGHKTEDTLVIENTRIAHFSGDGARLDNVWGFTVRNNLFYCSIGDGLAVTHWDGWIHNNIMISNGGYGYAGRLGGNGAITITANRIEWNHKGGILIQHGGNYNITGNYFDRSGGPGVHIDGGPNRAAIITMTGNIFSRSGARAAPDSHESSQILAENVDGLVVTGNTMRIGTDDDGGGQVSPAYGVVYGGLKNSIIRNNAMHNGAVRQLMLDLGGHDAISLIEANIGTTANHPLA
jgi:hypothetical protein